MEIFFTILAILAVIFLLTTIKTVPQQEAWIVERFGKFDKVLQPGLNILIPFVQSVSYKHSLKEQAIDITAQTAISKDNVSLNIDGILYTKIIDAKAASYGVSNPYIAITQLAQTSMRSEIGKIPLDQTFEEREMLNVRIVTAINEAAINWGIQCMRYEIKDIQPPKSVLQAMELQVAAERQKRAHILESEGLKQSQINSAEASKTQVVLSSEAAYTDKINRARGDAEAITLVASATASSIKIIAESIQSKRGEDAVSLKIAEKYIEAFSQLAKTNNTLIIPSNLSEVGSFTGAALEIFKNIKSDKKN
jgi:regulator of protease activity HflC (stomatin/prohibitin superfamily)